jgi:branched-subunit amino acid permease
MSAAWLPAFEHLYRHPELLEPNLSGTTFASQVFRRVAGIVLYAVAAVIGRFLSPILATTVFILVVGYYAWTSQGIHSRDAGQRDLKARFGVPPSLTSIMIERLNL